LLAMSWRARLSVSLRELRILHCNSDVSKGVREFLHANYSNLKMLNPNLPILVRSYESPTEEEAASARSPEADMDEYEQFRQQELNSVSRKFTPTVQARFADGTSQRYVDVSHMAAGQVEALLESIALEGDEVVAMLERKGKHRRDHFIPFKYHYDKKDVYDCMEQDLALPGRIQTLMKEKYQESKELDNITEQDVNRVIDEYVDYREKVREQLWRDDQ